METVTKNKLYEGMFLADSALAGPDWDGVKNTIKKILEKAGAEIVTIKKWDDRKLAYEIRGKSRGTYILCYFRADGGKIKDIENAVKLSEHIMRVLILNAEKMTSEDIEKDTPATRVEKEMLKEPDETEQKENDSPQDNTDEESEQENKSDTETEQDEQEQKENDSPQDNTDEESEQENESDTETEQDEQEQKEKFDSEQDSEIRD